MLVLLSEFLLFDEQYETGDTARANTRVQKAWLLLMDNKKFFRFGSPTWLFVAECKMERM